MTEAAVVRLLRSSRLKGWSPGQALSKKQFLGFLSSPANSWFQPEHSVVYQVEFFSQHFLVFPYAFALRRI